MKKMIKIDGHEYFMQSSAYTQFAYKDETGRIFLNDVQSLVKLSKDKNRSINSFDKITTLLLKVSYIMIKEADEEQVADYTSFVKSIESLYDDEKWVNDVIELAVTPISRQLQKIK